MANWQAAIDDLGAALADALDHTARRIRSALREISIAAPESSARIPAGMQLPMTELSQARQRVVDFTEKYWKNYNPDYPSYSSDCANFVSQAIESGGFQQKMTRDRFNDPNDHDPNAWFSQYDENTFTEDWEASRTWTYAPDLHQFLTEGSVQAEDGTPTGTAAPESVWTSPDASVDPNALSSSGLQPGDIVFYERTNDEGKPEITHTAVYVGQDWITMPDGSRVWGDVVNQHTTDRHHAPWFLPGYAENPDFFPIKYRPVKIDYPE